MVAANEGRLVQVLRNLLANAMSFSPPRGSITLFARREGRRIRLSVADQGPGIPPDKLDAIFDRFYTERPAGEKFGTHSGLGLSISAPDRRGPWRAALRREPDRSGRHHPRRALHAPPAGRMSTRGWSTHPSPVLRNGRGISSARSLTNERRRTGPRPDPCQLRRYLGRGRAAARPARRRQVGSGPALVDGGGALVADDLCEIRREGGSADRRSAGSGGSRLSRPDRAARHRLPHLALCRGLPPCPGGRSRARPVSRHSRRGGAHPGGHPRARSIWASAFL